jgi:hypothetical protein
MNPLTSRATTVVLSAALVVIGLELTAYAANGHPLLLGGVNHSVGATTVVNDGLGPALKLKTGKGQPPLAVNSRARVTNLNADTVDGLQGKSLRTNARVFSIPGMKSHQYLLKGVRPGRYLATLDVTLASSGTAGCALEDSHTGEYLAFASGASDGLYAGASAAAVITLPPGSSLLLSCNNDITDVSFFHNTVSVSPMGTVTQGKVAKFP